MKLVIVADSSFDDTFFSVVFFFFRFFFFCSIDDVSATTHDGIVCRLNKTSNLNKSARCGSRPKDTCAVGVRVRPPVFKLIFKSRLVTFFHAISASNCAGFR